jgi:hypothetical protein
MSQSTITRFDGGVDGPSVPSRPLLREEMGGEVSDYLPLHSWFDQSKAIAGDFRHRALRHHAEGIFMLVIWTGKPASMEVVVPVVHRRGPPSA